MTTQDDLTRYHIAADRLEQLIALDPPQDRSPDALRTRAEHRLENLERFLAVFGNPHRATQVIHVAGTSGKGSTSTAIAAILEAAGRRTLLHTSPYLQVGTEKLQIGGRLISPADFANLAEEVLEAAARWPDPITYGEAWMAIVALAMREQRPDVAVIEVGAGGRFDLTNLVVPDVAVITTIGYDHTETLGSTLAEIAWHKAGIIKPGVAVVHAVTEPEPRSEIDLQIHAVGAGHVTVINHSYLPLRRTADNGWAWQDAASHLLMRSGIPGFAQVINGAIAAAAVRAFDPTISAGVIQQGLADAEIPARFEQVASNPMVILDGAHNAQKMTALTADLEQLSRPRVGIVGFLASKPADTMLEVLLPHLDHIVLLAPEITGKPGLAPIQAAELVRRLADISIATAENEPDALAKATTVAGSDGTVIVTGSLYLCGAVRELFYPASAILEQQTPWPTRQQQTTGGQSGRCS
ncbi:MAG TPA: Mur ligase family protein [Thermomicrobiales bacterium]|nr:Mur ligase family protein [Thermomicrobiales bacterium]